NSFLASIRFYKFPPRWGNDPGKLLATPDSLIRNKINIFRKRDADYSLAVKSKIIHHTSSLAHFDVLYQYKWDTLDDIVRECSTEQRLIIGSDLNGHIGASADGYTGINGGFGFGAGNEEGRAILEFATAHDLVVANSLFKKSDAHLITFQSGGHNTQIDYLLVEEATIELARTVGPS
nr:craniofacial development protein 2-like [Tanacetum cinerariifolium]